MTAKISVLPRVIQDNERTGESKPVIRVERDGHACAVQGVEILDAQHNVVARVVYRPSEHPPVYVEAGSIRMIE